MDITVFQKGGYIEAMGRRKTASARVRISKSPKNIFLINGQPLDGYLPKEQPHLKNKLLAPLIKDELKKLNISAKVVGGGFNSQVESIQNGLSKAIIKTFPDERQEQKKLGFLRVDTRRKERKKPGLKKARKAPQWSKR